MFTEPVKGNAGNHTIVCLIAKLLHFSDSQQTHTSSNEEQGANIGIQDGL